MPALNHSLLPELLIIRVCGPGSENDNYNNNDNAADR